MIPINTQDEAIKILLAGGVGVMPTDTVYGLVARAADKAAVARLYALKSREHKPGTLIAANVGQLVKLGVNRDHLKLVERWWPNPLSVVCGAGEELEYLHQGLDSLAVRVPKDEALQKLLEQTGPLVTSSANHPGELSAVAIAEAQAYFGDSVDFYVDGGDLSGRLASTLIRVTNGSVEMLREGLIKMSDLT